MTPYFIDEGSIPLPEGFHDRSTNIFVLGEPDTSTLNFNIARARLRPGEDLPGGTARLMRIEDQVGWGIGFQRDETGLLECVASQGQVLRLRCTQGNSNSVIHIELMEGSKPGPLVMYNYDARTV